MNLNLLLSPKIKIILIAITILFLNSCQMNQHKKDLEKLLNTNINISEDQIDFYKWEPNDETTLKETYAKFPLSHQEYLTMVENAHLHKKIDKGEALGHFPFHWKTYSQIKLNWWDATSANPDDEAVKKIGKEGALMVKFENGFVYLVAKENE
jgi:hypothetical protein